MFRSFFKFISESFKFTAKTPKFWRKESSVGQAFIPLSAIYFLAKRFLDIFSPKPQKFNSKIICVGNVIAGGAGKTPICGKLADILSKNVEKSQIAIISTGYKAKKYGPVKIDTTQHNAAETGDEPYLLALKGHNVVMCKNRVKAIQFAESLGYKYLILDDGLHDKRVQKDISFIVIEGNYGVGNELILPAGPLRDRLDYAVADAQNIILIGKDKNKSIKLISQKARRDFTIFEAYLEFAADYSQLIYQQDESQEIPEPDGGNDKEKGEDRQKIKYIAFSGMARPEKFHKTLEHDLQLEVVKQVEYDDHHKYSEEDFDFLNSLAEKHNAKLITTEKDYVKIPSEFADNIEVIRIKAEFIDEKSLLERILK